MKGLFGNEKVSAALVLPGLLVIIFSLVVPIGFSAYFSLTDWAGFGKFHMVGLQNYKEILFSDAVFWRSLMNALILMVVTVFIQNPAAFALAALLAHITEKLSRIFRTIFFIPAVLSLIVVAKLWVSLFNPTYGIINKVLVAVGLKAIAVSWLSNPHTALGAVIWIIIWQGFGWALLFYYTGLMTVPREIEEATRVDGAGWLQAYLRVIIPFMFPVVSAVLVIDVISCLKQMEMIFLSTEGGPGQLTQFVSVYLYQKAFIASQYGYGNALSVLFVVVAVGITLVVQRLLRRNDDVQ
ncbi:MAG TPA: sugar ABC transporter permease [Spirochaetia bacterium]|nr:sugar ABC transporter permease [Spirochaetia bacterium]